jgi:endo-1,3-1,4-beta-glycanase ExoK
MPPIRLPALCLATVLLLPNVASATKSAELYTAASHGYGRFEARIRFAAGDGIVSSFFLWKDGSEIAGTFWNEIDFEKLGADCHLQTNPLYGLPVTDHGRREQLSEDLCGAFHEYAIEWTPEAIAWLLDGTEIRRETGAAATAFAENAPNGMQLRFNIWPGDASFGGNFDPNVLPVHQYIDWVQYSSYADGEFTVAWREDFDGTTIPSAWLTGSWASPKNRSTHDTRNVNIVDGYAVLSLTADDATGPAGADPTGENPSSGDDDDIETGGGSDTDEGCSCRTVGSSRSSAAGAGLGAALLAAVVGLSRRRSRAQRRRA